MQEVQMNRSCRQVLISLAVLFICIAVVHQRDLSTAHAQDVCDECQSIADELQKCQEQVDEVCDALSDLVKQLSDCLAQCQSNAVKLISFSAAVSVDGSVTLTWQTATEVDNAGFNLYRTATAGGPYAKITGAIIPAQGNAVAGASYSFVDTPGAGLFHYLLEDLDTAGVRTLHGPIWVTVGSWPSP